MKTTRPPTPDRNLRLPPIISESLEKRASDGALRSLACYEGLVDFSSNDYLGFSTTGALKKQLEREIGADTQKIGSTGSRLLSGNSSYAEETEALIAEFHGCEASLIYSTGYAANIGLLPAVTTRHDTILYDELCHASLIDGIRLSHVKRAYKFRHNDIEDLRDRLRRSGGTVFIVVESIYSMDGDRAPLEEICELARENGCYVIVDEAHAIGVLGARGEGLVSELQLESEVFARVETFGKGPGAHGAAICGSNLLRNYLINFSRPFIYSTAPEFETFRTIRAVYNLLDSSQEARAQLFSIVDEFRGTLAKLGLESIGVNAGPIQIIPVPTNAKAKSVAEFIRNKGMDVRAILSPSVAKGSERLRICLHAFNTSEQISRLGAALKESL